MLEFSDSIYLQTVWSDSLDRYFVSVRQKDYTSSDMEESDPFKLDHAEQLKSGMQMQLKVEHPQSPCRILTIRYLHTGFAEIPLSRTSHAWGEVFHSTIERRQSI